MSVWSSLENFTPVEAPCTSAEAGHQGRKKCIANVVGWRAQQAAGTQSKREYLQVWIEGSMVSWKCIQRLTESFGYNRNFSSAIWCSEYSEEKKTVFLFKKCLIIWSKHIFQDYVTQEL